jgi:hypothetical protein
MDARRISGILGTEPTLSYTAGEPRVSPTGRPLGSVHSESLWVLDINVAAGSSIADAVGVANALLVSKRGELASLRNDGARVEYFIGLFLDAHHTETFEASLMKSCSDLSVTLIVNTYLPEWRRKKSGPVDAGLQRKPRSQRIAQRIC